MKTLAKIAVGLALIAFPSTVIAQDQFGSAVAIDGERVLVMKPGAGIGPAAILVYERINEVWTMVDELTVSGAGESGEGFSASMAIGGDVLVAAGGDADVRVGAHVYRKNASGYSTGTPHYFREPSAGEQRIDLAAVMRILQPAPRFVASDGSTILVGGLSGTWVSVLGQASGGGPFSEMGSLEAPTEFANQQFGRVLAVSGDRAVIGIPMAGRGGVVFYQRDRQAEWRVDGMVNADSSDVSSRFGAMVAIDQGDVIVGADGLGGERPMVVTYRRNARGQWDEVQRVFPTDTTARSVMTSMAVVGDELLLGTPRDAQSLLKRYHRNADGQWESARFPILQSGAGLGPSMVLAASERLAAIGFANAAGGDGRVLVFELRDGAWSSAAELSLDRRPTTTIAGAERPCAEGRAEQFTCENVDIQAFLPIAAIGGELYERVSDLWGWTDPNTGREFALVGRTGGIAIVDITQATEPRYLGVLAANPAYPRDIKVYQDHLFATGEGPGQHGLLVFDLTRLREQRNVPTVFQPDTVYHGIGTAHNLVIDTENGFAIPVGSSGGQESCGGGLHIVDIKTPKSPTFLGCYTDTRGLIAPGRTHDAQCVAYRGPDVRYHEKSICFVSNETILRIVDITDGANPVPISAADYPGASYVHQGWLTDDQRYFYLNDELDELVGRTDRTRTLIWDVAELDDPVLVGEYFGPSGATDHNLYVKGDLMYQANYTSGMRIIDISDRGHPVEVGFFDTTPYDGNPPGFSGAWTAFPYFDSGTVIVSSMSEGLFILKPRAPALIQ